MIKQDILEIEGVEYTFVQADFFETEAHARRLLSFADGIVEVTLVEDEDGVRVPDFDVNFGAIFANLSGPQFDKVRDFLFKTIKVVDNGKGVEFSDKLKQSQHFSKYRNHYTQVLVAGFKFHFLDFLPSGGEYVKNMFSQATNRAVAQVKG